MIWVIPRGKSLIAYHALTYTTAKLTNHAMTDIYNPTSYWLERGKTYESQSGWGPVEQKLLLDYLKTLDFKSVLEVGCGYGRVTEWIADEFKPERYDAIDLSPDQIARAKVSGVNFAVRTIQEFETAYRYDLVLAAEVLLHILPSEIEGIIAKLLRLGRHLIHIDPIRGENMQPHNFIHPYFSIYKKLGKRVNAIPVHGQHIIHAH